MYRNVLEYLREDGGTQYVMGLTATPWRPDDHDVEEIIGPIVFSMDLVAGMRGGFLANVDYRLHVDNIDWDAVSGVTELTPRALNRRLFIKEWDDAVIDSIQNAWSSQANPKCIVFCGTIDHAQTISDQINARGFAKARSIHSQDGKRQRQLTLSQFHDGSFDILCAVDILNEGIDVPDVNMVVFQRVTHSRRIFVQQLGRGLRISPGKENVLVLDFVSDIRRFAAGLELAASLGATKSGPEYIQYGSPVTFHTVKGPDDKARDFISEWLQDVASVADANEDQSILKYPPSMSDVAS
jgi:superfamily II DNA or RNA helicase